MHQIMAHTIQIKMTFISRIPFIEDFSPGEITRLTTWYSGLQI